MSRLLVATILLLAPFGSEASAQPEPAGFEIHLVGPAGAAGERLRQAVVDDLARTPRRHRLVVGEGGLVETPDSDTYILALLEPRLDPEIRRPVVQLADAEELRTPGWLVHAVTSAGSTVGVEVEVVDSRSSWLGQLVARSTSRLEAGAADLAASRGVPAAVLLLPADDPSSERLLAATVRRLDGLDGYPVFEDQFLVVAGRVLLRRDLYWVGLLAWLGLFFRGRRRAGREFRWLLLVAWLVAPVHAGLLLILPALVAAWLPDSRWAAGLALAPALYFVLRLALAVAGDRALAVSGIPALLVALTLAAFAWFHLLGRGGLAAQESTPASAPAEAG